MKKLRLGIIGYGFMGQWHNNHAGTLEEVEIVAICDTDSEKRAEAPENVKLYTDYKALLADFGCRVGHDLSTEPSSS